MRAIPVPQQVEGFGQRIGDHRIMDAARQHGRQRSNEGQPDKSRQGQD